MLQWLYLGSVVVAGWTCGGVEHPRSSTSAGRSIKPHDEAMSIWTFYLQPETVDEALSALMASDGRSRVIAGGTDLLLDLQQGRLPPVETLIDVGRVEGMSDIVVEDGEVYIGAAATHRRIIEHPALQWHAQALIEACELIGGPQVRNVATLGGNVAHALPAADGSIALLALQAQAEIAGPAGRRWEPVETLFAAPGEPTFDRRTEILVRFRAAGRQPGEGSAFRRVMRPQGVAIAILNMGAWLQIDPAGAVRQARISVGPSGPVPYRARAAEACLIGKPLEEAVLAEAQTALRQEARLRTSRHRATAEYRQHLLDVLLRRTLQAAYQRAGERAVAPLSS
jgi:xanthine dehydrogenase FAD-binding subunit